MDVPLCAFNGFHVFVRTGKRKKEEGNKKVVWELETSLADLKASGGSRDLLLKHGVKPELAPKSCASMPKRPKKT